MMGGITSGVSMQMNGGADDGGGDDNANDDDDGGAGGGDAGADPPAYGFGPVLAGGGPGPNAVLAGQVHAQNPHPPAGLLLGANNAAGAVAVAAVNNADGNGNAPVPWAAWADDM